jgi:hypothetical protein
VDTGLSALRLECKQWMKARNMSFGMRAWTLNTISVKTRNDVPTLESKAKAALTKNIFLWAAGRATQVAERDERPYVQIRSEMVWCLAHVIHICDRHAEFIPREDADIVYKDGNRFLELYCYLAGSALQSGRCAWKVCAEPEVPQI